MLWYFDSGQELFGTVIYKPEKIMVIVLEDLNEDTLMGSPAAHLLTETVMDLVRPTTYVIKSTHKHAIYYPETYCTQY